MQTQALADRSDSGHDPWVLIAVSGLPGVGKTSVAAESASRIGAVHLSVDVVMDGLLRAGLDRDEVTGMAAFEGARAAAEQNLLLGHLVVVDAVNDSEPYLWREAARHAQVQLRFVLLQVPEEDENRRRLQERGAQRTDLSCAVCSQPRRERAGPTWEQVRDRARGFETWNEPLLEFSSTEPTKVLVQRIRDELHV